MPPRLSQSSTPHSVSLKVLRLSKPSPTPSLSLPEIPSHPSLQSASLPYPSANADGFPLAPILTLPPSFGAAYVGETFSCTLSANNELGPDKEIAVRDVRVEAELQTPGVKDGVELAVEFADGLGGVKDGGTREGDGDGDGDGDGGAREGGGDGKWMGQGRELDRGKSRQGIIKYDLKEEGPHVLAVTVTYTEVEGEEERRRTFRKLYQFSAQQAVGVRTKIGELKGFKTKGFAVEAQVENLTAGEVVLEAVRLEMAEGVAGCGLNGDRMWLGPGDVEQVAFRLEEEGEIKVEGGRYVLAQLKVDWRMAMGQDGTLKTGWLGCLKRS
ncbi:hypothetical protein BDZ85DRAFT_321548 [Elsinoe ampelina]|uniref:Trafficking protein particle complex subunit 13 N-terminal domain-containing protein n=1 Tax=Elsinoe ampelina TaxID=302913 RepID=A0A6A6G3C8_9PEZI|nr:hypothetical protein BDZ85DRAFT_321548 [Elsinoe ampelina]